MELDSAPILEVFASFQGEGLFVGQAQTFLRLAGCPLRCRYCDTPHSWERPRAASDGEWLTPFEALVRVKGVEYDGHRPISVTGGEPLVWERFLRALRGVAGDRPLHLETAGHDAEALRRVAAHFDHLSLDLKRAADLAPPARSDWPELDLPDGADDFDRLRAAQLGLLAERANRGHRDCVKLVVVPEATPESFQPLLDDVRRLAHAVPVYIAPASPRHDAPFTELQALDRVASLALELGLEPRILPQMHRALGVR